MASALASQLQQLATSFPPAQKQRGKLSLLFDAQKAADVDVQTIYEIGCQGLEDLTRLDGRFVQFKESLFSRSALALNRDQQTTEVIEQLDAGVAAFCTLLSNHFLHPAAFKALEFLIRRFRVNECNVDALLSCALPYHSTNEFVRLVQTMPLAHSTWAWLAKGQSSGAALPRDLLVKRCINDKAVLDWVCQTAARLGTRSGPSRTFLSFYAILMTEVSAAAKIDEALLNQLLSHIVTGLASDAAPDYRAGTMMLVAELASKAELGQQFLKVILTSMLRHLEGGPEHVRTALLLAAHIALTQPHLQIIPPKALTLLLAIPQLKSELSALSKSRVKLQPLLQLLLQSLLGSIKAGASDVDAGKPRSGSGSMRSKASEALLLELVQLGLFEPVAQQLAAILLRVAVAAPAEGQERSTVQGILRQLETSHPTQVNAAVNEALAQHDTMSMDVDGTVKEGGAEQVREHENALLQLVQSTFQASAAAPFGQAHCTLRAALTSPVAQIRRVALQSLDDQFVAVAEPSEDAAAALQQHGLSALRDDSLEVVSTALGLHCWVPSSVSESCASMLCGTLEEVLQRCAALPPLGTTPAAQKLARQVIIKALPLLAATASAHPTLIPGALLQLLQLSLPPLQHPAISSAALSSAAGLQAHSAIAAALAPHHQTSTLSKAAKQRLKKDAPAAADASTPQQQLRAIIASLGALFASDIAAVAEARALLLHAGRTCQQGGHLLMAGLRAATATATPASLTPTQTAALSAFSEVAFLGLTGQQLRLGAGPSPAAAAAASQAGDGASDATLLLQAGEEVQDARTVVQKAHALMLQAGLLQGLAAAVCIPHVSPASDAATQEQHVTAAFAALASLPSVATFLPHLHTLLSAYPPGYEAASLLLANIHSSPSADVSTAVRCAAFGVQKSMLTSAALLSASSVQQLPSANPPPPPPPLAHSTVHVPWVCHAITALGSAVTEVRTAATELLLTLTPLLLDGSVHVTELAHSSPTATGAGIPAFLATLLQHAKSIISDAEASTALLRSCFTPSSASTSASTPAAVPGTPPSGLRRLQKAHAYLSNQLPLLPASGCAGAPTALALLHLLLPHNTPVNNASSDVTMEDPTPASAATVPAELFQPAMLCLQALLASALPPRSTADGAHATASSSDATAGGPSAPQADLASELLRLLTPDSVSQAPMPLLILFAAVLQPPSSSPTPATPQTAASIVTIRIAALTALTPSLFLAMPPALQPVLLKALLAAVASGTESSPAEQSVPQSQQKPKRGKRDDGSAALASISPIPTLPAGALASAVPALELLQTRATEVSGPVLLISSLQSLLRMLLPVLGSIATSASEDPTSAADADDSSSAAADPQQQLPERSSLAGYAAQLVLVVLSRLAHAHVGGGVADPALQQFDLSLAVKAAQEAPDSAVRNAALSLVAALATLKPDDALGHVLQVIALVNVSSIGGEDSHGQAMAAAAVSAIVPAWLAGGRDASSLWAAVIPSLEGIVAHRRLPLLAMLLSSMTQVQRCPSNQAHDSELHLWAKTSPWVSAHDSRLPPSLTSAVISPTLLQEPAASLPPALLLLLSAATQAKPSEATAAETAAEGVDASSAGADSSSKADWLPELASQLALEVVPAQRVPALSALLEAALKQSGEKPLEVLTRSSVSFVAVQLQLMSLSNVAQFAAKNMAPDAVAARAEHANVLRPACRSIMAAALHQMQLLQPLASSNTTGQRGAKKAAKAVRAAREGLYGLFGSLQGVMPPADYLQALVQLAQQPSDAVRRRALKLFGDKVASLQSEVSSASAATGSSSRSAKAHESRLQSLATAALSIAPLLPQLLRSGDPATPAAASTSATATAAPEDGDESSGSHPSAISRQAALVALQASATLFGSRAPGPLLECLPCVLACVSGDSHSSVRGSGLAAVAAIVQALGARLVPLLPATVRCVVAVSNSSWQRLATLLPTPTDTPSDAAMGAGTEAAEPSDEEAERERRQQEAAVELAASLAALRALVEHCGAFLSPHLPDLLSLLLQPHVLRCSVGGCAAFAAGVRQRLPTALPARLLLPALYARLQPSVDGGITSFSALLQLVADCVTSMDGKAAAAHADAMFTFLLQAMDVRQLRPASLAGCINEAEAAVADAMVALVMKLSEARFKPLFMRMLQWATSLTVSTGLDGSVQRQQGSVSYVGRMAAMFGAVVALTDRLRSVFVPYFRHLLDLAVQHLGGLESGSSGSKRRKTAQLPGTAAAATPGGDAAWSAEAEDAWVTRVRVVAALRRCFQHDSVDFLDPERFARILPSLAAQLDAEPPASLAPACTAACTPSNANASKPGQTVVDPWGDSVVGCLSAMALATGSDLQWKPLNHAVLMQSRRGSPRTRRLALATVSLLVAQLREEYLVLLPETLPFLAELLEDIDVGVEAAAQGVVVALEEVSGEKLDQYLK
ncbi:MAG: hypothetical protein WDW38_009944 [Sanguina aurantia]